MALWMLDQTHLDALIGTCFGLFDAIGWMYFFWHVCAGRSASGFQKISVWKSAAHNAYLKFLRARRSPLLRARRMLRGGINGESRHLSVGTDDARMRLTERGLFLTTSLGRAAGLRADALRKR